MFHEFEFNTPIQPDMAERILRIMRVRGFEVANLQVIRRSNCLEFRLQGETQRPITQLYGQLEKVYKLKLKSATEHKKSQLQCHS
ncbi:MAG: hypothetical protein KUG79_14285 [Pseudomonadales bacterium]|nr:hypothetical protein [Pseudomonadales bacterium]